MVLLLISLFIINFLISENFNNDKIAIFAQETTSGQFSTYTNEEYGITMQYPSDWIKDEDVDSDSGVTITFSKDIDEYKGDVSLTITPSEGLSLSDHLETSIDAYEELSDDFELVSSSSNTDQTLAGSPAYILEYKDKDETNFGEIETRYLEVGAKIGNDYYYVEYFAEDGDDYTTSLPIAQKMIDSIKIGKDAATSTLSQTPQQQSQPQQPESEPQSQPAQPQQKEPQPQQQPKQPQQNLNNMNQQQQLVDQIATTISTANNNIDKNKVIQAVNDFIESAKAKSGDAMEPLKKLARIVSNDPTGVVANSIINTAKTK